MNSQSDRGSILVLTLWVVAVAALAGIAVIAVARTPQYLARNAADELTRKVGLQNAAHLVLRDVFAGELKHEADGRTFTVTAKGMVFNVAVQDEAGRIDLNSASDQIMEQLLAKNVRGPASRSQFIDVLSDWRDSDDLRRESGAEKEAYLAAGLPFSPRNRPLAKSHELFRLLVPDAVRLDQMLVASSTVYSRRSSVELEKAPAHVLRSLFDETEARSLIGTRNPQSPDSASPAGRTFTIFVKEPTLRSANGWKGTARLTGVPLRPFELLAWEHLAAGEARAYFDDAARGR